MFERIAPYYDQIKGHRDYEHEASVIDGILQAGSLAVGSIVELGCGTGSLLKCLEGRGYSVTGVDESLAMLEVAGAKLTSEAKLDNASFLTYKPGIEFDASVWIDGAIGYVSPEQVEQVLANINDMTRAGGKVLIEPWYSRDTWRPNTNHVVTHETEAGDIVVRLSHGNFDGSIDFHHLFANTEGVTHYKDTTKFWLHDYRSICAALDDIGLISQELPPSPTFKRGLILAIKEA